MTSFESTLYEKEMCGYKLLFHHITSGIYHQGFEQGGVNQLYDDFNTFISIMT